MGVHSVVGMYRNKQRFRLLLQAAQEPFFFFFNPSIDSSSAVFAKPLAQLASCFISEDRNENCPRLFNIVGIKAFTLILTSLHIRCSFSGSNRKFKNADD